MWAVAILVGIFIGVVGELVANLLSLWVYQRSISALINILVMFGLVMGSLSLLVPSIGYWLTGVVGLMIGYSYEMANFSRLHWWKFPQNKFLIFHGRQACAIAVAVLWAVIPIVINLLTGLLVNLF